VSCETLFHDVIAFSGRGDLHFLDLAGDPENSPRLQRYRDICPAAECKDPVISPDGRLIAFTDRVDTHIARVATGGVIATFRTDGEDYIQPLTWAPDTKAVAFTARVPGGPGRDLYVRSVSVSGVGPAARLRHDNIDILEPTWSPDGEWIAHTRHPWNESTYQIWLIRPDGTDARPLAPSGSTQRWPTWSPDGATIAYLSGGAIRLHALATGVERTLPVSVVSPEALRFTTDGDGLVLSHSLGDCTHAVSRIDLQGEVLTRLHTAVPDCSIDRLPISPVSWGTQ
jgi:Tol biopolymer transport system component